MANEQQASSPDSMYSIAENVRRVSGTEEKKGEKRIETAVKQKEKARPRPIASPKVPKPVSVKSTPARKETKKRSERNRTIIVSKEKETGKEPNAEEEYIDIKPGWFWKISTVVLAIMVIWAYFFR